MSNNINEIIQQNINFANDHAQINLNFVYAQLDNISKLLGNESFMHDISGIINNVLDRNHDGKFNSDDIKLLKEIFTKKHMQMVNITNFCLELFNSIMLAVGKVEKPILKLNKNALEGVFFGVLTYTMFQYGPSNKDKEDIIMIIATVYNILSAVGATQEISTNIIKLFKKKGWCKCLTKDTTNADVQLVKNVAKMKNTVDTAKQIVILHNENDELKKQLVFINNSNPVEESFASITPVESSEESHTNEPSEEQPTEESVNE